MEKPPKPMTKIFSFLPRAASAVIAFQNLPFSPGRDKIGPSERANHHHHHHNNNNNHRFSGPLIPNKSFDELGFDGPEPTSPKISCMGQIKHKKSKIEIKANKDKIEDPARQGSKLKRFFSGKLEKKAEPLARSSVRDDCIRLPDRAPSLSQAKRFASGRDVLADFDWSAPPFTPVDKELRDYYSDDEERGGRMSGSGEEDEFGDEDKEDIIIPFSAPLPVGTWPRKEVNLWKRRTMAPPRPLQLQY